MESRQAENNSQQVFWVILGSLSALALGLVSAAILSRYFSKEDYGSYKQVIYIYNALLVVFSAGLPKVYSYYLPRYNIAEGKSVVKRINYILALTGLLFSICLFAGAPLFGNILKNPDIVSNLRIFAVVPLFLLPTLGIEGIFSVYKKTVYIAIYNTITRFLMLLCIVIPVIFFDGSFRSAIYGWVAASFITFIIALYFKNIPFKNVQSKRTHLKTKEIFTYSLPIAVAGIFGISVKAADQFYISRYFGVEEFADFSNGFMELPFVGMITTATSIVLMPIFAKVFYENEGVDNLLVIWRNTMKKTAMIIYPLLIFFLAFSSEAMVLLYSGLYKSSAGYFQINILLNFFNIIIFGPLFFSMGKTRLYANIHILLAVIIWSTHYIIVEAFSNPYLIAINSTFWSILKILWCMYLAAKFMRMSFLDFLPLKFLYKPILQSVLLIFLIKFFLKYFMFDSSSITVFIGSALTFMIGIFISGRIFKLDYFGILKPLLEKIRK